MIRNSFVLNPQSAFILFLLFCMFACSGKTGKDAMRLPGQTILLDEAEKSRLLEFYSAPDDSLKKKAAMFLLEHISAHYSSESPVLERLEEKYAKEKRRKEYTGSYEAFSSILEAVMEDGVVADLERISDDSLVTGDYLIEHIEQAFKVRKNKDRTEDVDFETFCEYILPYRVMDEPLDYDRNYFRKKYAFATRKERDMRKMFDAIAKTFPVGYHKSMDNEFPDLMGIGLSYKVGAGNCMQQAVSMAMIARSVGIPATVDYVPQWGNYHGKHYMAKLIDGKKKNAFDLSFFDDKFTIPKDSLPEWISGIQCVKTIPKVYRMTWSVQPERLLLNSNGRTEGTGLFQDMYEKDVTDEYTDCSTFSLQAGDSVDIAYLCVFGRNGWTPVCAAPANGDSAVFEKVGRGIVYLPTTYKSTGAEEGYMLSLGPPFYFSDKGECITLDDKGGGKQRARLYSKYPMFSYTASHVRKMKGGKFQGAHKSDFSDAKTLFTIDYYPFYRQEIKVENNGKFRYFRYLPPPDVIYSFAELQFYTQDRDNHPVRIPGIYFERYKSGRLNAVHLGDDDLDTYVMGIPVKESWIGYDTGENKEARLTGIVFAPQNDGNCIVPGYTYELFFWQGDGWKSLGSKQTKTDFLEYDNLPQHALFLLKCHTRGVEERIFTLENEVQVWW